MCVTVWHHAADTAAPSSRCIVQAQTAEPKRGKWHLLVFLVCFPRNAQLPQASSPTTSYSYSANPEHHHSEMICQSLSSIKATGESEDPCVPVAAHRLSVSKTCPLCRAWQLAGSGEPLPCSKLNFQCVVADKRKKRPSKRQQWDGRGWNKRSWSYVDTILLKRIYLPVSI